METSINKGTFFNEIRYVKVGDGTKIVFVLLGGPGDMIKSDRAEAYGTLFTDLITNGYTIYVVSRGNNLKEGKTLFDMGQDISDIITHHFEGSIEAVIGYSYGGFIVQQLAGNFPACSKKYITLGTAYYMPSKAEEIDSRLTEYIIQKDYLEAFRMIPELVYTDIEQINQLRAFIEHDPQSMFENMYHIDYPNFYNDIKIENDALHALNHKEVVTKITKPMMIIGGTSDMYFSTEDMKETAKLVPSSTLVLLEGKGHGELLTMETVTKITDFILEKRY